MSRFNEWHRSPPAPAARMAARPPALRAVAVVVLCMVLINTLGRALAAGPDLMPRYLGLIVTQLACVAAPALLMALVGSHPAAWMFRLRLPRASAWAPVLVMAVSGFVLACSLEEWTQRLFGPLPALDWEGYAPAGGFQTAAALLALAAAPAFSEELLYRGYVLRAFETLGSRLLVSLAVGAIFSAAHMSPGTFPAHLLLGWAITFVVMSTGSIYPGMLLHAAVNGLTVVLWRSELLDRLPGSIAANLAAASLFAAGMAWLARAPMERIP